MDTPFFNLPLNLAAPRIRVLGGWFSESESTSTYPWGERPIRRE